jgi:hypothetical protein
MMPEMKIKLSSDDIDFLLWCLGHAQRQAMELGQPHLMPRFDAVRLKLLDLSSDPAQVKRPQPS